MSRTVFDSDKLLLPSDPCFSSEVCKFTSLASVHTSARIDQGLVSPVTSAPWLEITCGKDVHSLPLSVSLPVLASYTQPRRGDVK